MNFKKIFSGYRFRAISIVITTLTVIILVLFSFGDRRTGDVVPKLSFLGKEAVEELGPFVTKVKTGLYIKNFTKFDVKKNHFVMDAVVWFEFHPGEVTLDLIEKFSFLNGKVTSRSTPNIKMIKNRVFVRYEVTVELFTDLNFPYFPYEHHRIPILLTNVYVSTEGMIFITTDDSFTLDPEISVSGWIIDGTSVSYGYEEAVFDLSDKKKRSKYSIAMFIIDFSTRGIKNVFVLFLPVLFALMLALFSLLVPLKEGVSDVGLGFSSASVTMLFAYRFVIESIQPKVGYMTTTDNVYMLAITVACISFFIRIISIVIRTIKRKKLDENQINIFNDKVNVIHAILFIILFLISVFFLYKTFIP